MFLRKFIILSKQSEQNTKGHAKLEVRGRRGKVSLSVENLKTEVAENDIYKTYLISDKENKFEEVDIGVIEVTKDGRGKLDWEFDPENIGKKNKDIKKFNIIAVRLDGLESGKTEVALAGYIHNDDNTIKEAIQQNSIQTIKENVEQLEEDDSVEETEETEDVEQLEDIEEQSQESEEAEESEEVETLERIEEVDQTEELEELEEVEEDTEEIEDIEETIESEEISEPEEVKEVEKADETLEDEISEQAELEEEEINQEETYETYEMYEIDELQGLEYEEDYETYDSYEHHESYPQVIYKDQISNYTLNILKFFDEVDPLKYQLEGHRWWQVEYDEKNIDKGSLPYYNYLINMYHPYRMITQHATCQSQIRKHGHYIFGTIEENHQVRHYAYGIPGQLKKEDQPYGGKTGFVTWYNSKEKETLGYWIIYIDALTGNIVKPI